MIVLFFVLLSDSSKNDKKESFGLERLKSVFKSKSHLSVHEIKNEILFAIEEFKNKNILEKDLVLIVLKVDSSILKLISFPSIQK